MKKIISILISIATLTSSSAALAQEPIGPFYHCDYAFQDVDCFETYFQAIQFAVTNKIAGGYPDGTFKPQNTSSRAELTKMIVDGYFAYQEKNNDQLENYKNTKCFDDVSTTAWCNKYVCFAKDKEWIVGYPDGSFKPQQTVKFTEALKITLGAFEISHKTDTTPWYRGAVEAASIKNQIPFTISTFSHEITRAEVADLLTRIIEEKRGALSTYLNHRRYVEVNFDTLSQGAYLIPLSGHLQTSLFKINHKEKISQILVAADYEVIAQEVSPDGRSLAVAYKAKTDAQTPVSNGIFLVSESYLQQQYHFSETENDPTLSYFQWENNNRLKFALGNAQGTLSVDSSKQVELPRQIILQ